MIVENGRTSILGSAVSVSLHGLLLNRVAASLVCLSPVALRHLVSSYMCVYATRQLSPPKQRRIALNVDICAQNILRTAAARNRLLQRVVLTPCHTSNVTNLSWLNTLGKP